jgi:hypothetical protein
MLHIKIEHAGALRRASVSRAASFPDARRAVAKLLGLAAETQLALQYRDQDQDLITIGSEDEWQQVLAEQPQDKALRLIATDKAEGATKESQTKQEETKQAPVVEPQVPFAQLARVLSQPETVRKIQRVATSPVITDAVNTVAQTYLDNQGSLPETGLVAAQQLPVLLGLINELTDDVPELKQAAQQAMMFGAEHFFHHPPHQPFEQFCGGGGGGGGGGGFGPRRGPFMPFGWGGPVGGPCGGPQLKTVHPHVFCDGCQSDAGLKRMSFANGHITRRGNINGLRFKSQQVDDFDLCESCKACGRFSDAAYGPFDTIQPPMMHHGHPGPRGRGCWRGGMGGECGAASAESAKAPAAPAAPTKPTPAPFDFGEALREAIVRGAEKVAEVTKDEDSEFSDLAKAIAQSLSLDGAAQTQAKSTVERVPVVPESASPKADGEWESVPLVPKTAEEDDPFVKWGSQLHQLATLGFSDSETYIRFLEEEQGDLDRVVSRIVSREA